MVDNNDFAGPQGGIGPNAGIQPNLDNLGGAGGEGGDDINQYYDDAGETFLPADHPLMNRLQNALTKQLTDAHERIDLQLREKDEEVRKIRMSREETGVQLYGVQHQLARMQTTFERTHDNYNIVQRYRVEAERQHEVLQRQYEGKKEEADEQLKRVLKAQEELNQLNRTLKQVEEYNEVMKSEIAVTRRTTYRAEENVVNLEKAKKGQDLLIDTMNEEIKRLNEQKTLYQAQLISQKEETAAARNTLKEAALEIERIIMSKKTLMNDWQKSIFEMERRDKALQAIKDMITQKNDEIMQLDSEISGLKTETRSEQNESEKLHDKLNALRKDVENVQQAYQREEAEKKRLNEQFVLLQGSLNNTDAEMKNLALAEKEVQGKQAILAKSIMMLHGKTKAIRDDIINHASQQKTIEKSSANLLKQTKNQYQDISKKEVEVEDLNNEISRVKIDNLNTKQQNDLLKNKLKELEAERTAKEKEVEEQEKLKKKNQVDITKKQLQVDQLNRKLADLKVKSGGKDDQNAGPLENKLSNMKKQAQELAAEIISVQKAWIANQAKLIDEQSSKMKTAGECDEIKTKTAILESKKLRLNNSVIQFTREIGQLELSRKLLESEMRKLNEVFAKNKSSKTRLANDNFNIEHEFKQKLKELENESIKLENQISQLKEEKADILAEIVEAERQILLWERKIQLEKEMQEEVDPEIGQSEIVAMRKEIHRMELMYDQLRKKQEEMIKNMERAVFKKETIQLKYQPKVEKKNAEDKSSKGKLSRQIANLKQTLRHTTDNTMQLDTTIEQRKREIDDISGDINAERDQRENTEKEVKRVQFDILANRLRQSKAQWRVASLDNMANRYDQCATNRFQHEVQEAQVRAVLDHEMQQNAAVESLAQRLRQENPLFDQIFSNLTEW